jgi:hypothetical protein
VGLIPLDTAATSGLLYKLQMINEGDCGATSGMKINFLILKKRNMEVFLHHLTLCVCVHARAQAHTSTFKSSPTVK